MWGSPLIRWRFRASPSRTSSSSSSRAPGRCAGNRRARATPCCWRRATLFYASWDLHLAGWLLAVSLLDWAVRRGAAPGAWSGARAAGAGCRLGVLANVGAAGGAEAVRLLPRSRWPRWPAGWGWRRTCRCWQLLAPVGLSFYTFQGIAYLVDAYRGQAVPAGRAAGFPAVHGLFPQAAGRAHLPLATSCCPSSRGRRRRGCPTRSGRRRWCCRG